MAALFIMEAARERLDGVLFYMLRDTHFSSAAAADQERETAAHVYK
jgi:hypothetical protein